MAPYLTWLVTEFELLQTFSSEMEITIKRRVWVEWKFGGVEALKIVTRIVILLNCDTIFRKNIFMHHSDSRGACLICHHFYYGLFKQRTFRIF